MYFHVVLPCEHEKAGLLSLNPWTIGLLTVGV
jgi:hypothetical protein